MQPEMDEQLSNVCCSTTTRTFELFSRRGSLLSISFGNSTEGPISPLHFSSKNIVSGSPILSKALNSMTSAASGSAQNVAVTPTSTAINYPTSFQFGGEQYSVHESEGATTQSNIDRNNDWRPLYPRLCAFHDCVSLASAWGLGPPSTVLEPRPTGASQAQSPTEDDAGDGKSNDLLSSCPAFRNELGDEPIRHVALTRSIFDNASLTNHSENETWICEHTAAEAGILEDVSNVYLGGRLCAARQSKVVIEPQDTGSYYFRHCFVGRTHYNFFGTDDNYGPIAVSMFRETIEHKENGTIHPCVIYRMIIRISDLRTFRVAVPEEAIIDGGEIKSVRALLRDLLELVCSQIQFSCLRPAATSSSRVEELLMKIDEQPIYTRYKVGVMYCGEGQSTEEEMYNNEHGSHAFEEFLEFLGQRVRLKGFDQYKGGLDTRGDTTGTHSVYTEYQAHEIMFHVSTLLPFTPSNKQQLARKRHIGNDMVTVIFQEHGALPFTPITVRSHFQHVFIIVRVNPRNESDDVTYTIAVSRAKDVPSFGPPIPRGATFQKCTEFHDFLLTKIINAENAVHRSKKFATMAARTRREALKDLAENFVSAHTNEGPSKIASRLLGGSVKRKERILPKPQFGECLRGALSWLVDVHEHSANQRITCVLGVSAETLVLLEMPSGIVIFATPTHSIIGWANTDMGLKIYYDHGQMLLLRCCSNNGSDRELISLIRRLECVTKGDEAKEIVYRKARKTENLGFHLQEEGVVTDVEMYQTAWKSGLRQGSRLVEIEGRPVITFSYEEMCEILANNTILRLVMISPAQDGSPRRGCEDPNCPAIKGVEDILLTPDTFAKQPLSYHDVLCRNQRLKEAETARRYSNVAENRIPLSFVLKGQEFNSRIHRLGIHRLNHPAEIKIGEVSGDYPKSYSQHEDESPSVYSPIAEFNFIEQSDDEKITLFESDDQSPFLTEIDEYDHSNQINKGSLISARLGKYHLKLQKVLQEKKSLEAIVEQLRFELAEERKSHEQTKQDLEKLRSRLVISNTQV